MNLNHVEIENFVQEWNHIIILIIVERGFFRKSYWKFDRKSRETGKTKGRRNKTTEIERTQFEYKI